MFQARKFLTEQFSDPQTLVASLDLLGLRTPELTTARKWFDRDAIPGGWLAILLYAIELQDDEPLSISLYMGATNDGRGGATLLEHGSESATA